MRRFHIRNAIVKRLKDEGYFVEAKDNEMQIPVCSYVFTPMSILRRWLISLVNPAMLLSRS